MPRLRQQFPQNYPSGSNINIEFENVIRYLNSAELGNKTIAELMKILFDSEGNFAGPIEFRRNSSSGIQYRVGAYTGVDDGWVNLATLEEIRGEPGIDVGVIGAPIFYGRVDTEAAVNQVLFPYAHVSTDDILVYVDGVLLVEGISDDYTHDPDGGVAGTVTLNTPLSGGEIVSIFKVRSTAITGYTRSDTLTTSSQAIFPFQLTDETRIMVFKNGILQREGGSYDYTTNIPANTVNFNASVPSGNLITILTVENTATTAVTGLMFEENFVHSDSGLIKFDKISVPDNAIAQGKVNGLAAQLGAKATIYLQGTTPVGAVAKDLWVDTSLTPNKLKFFDGVSWQLTSAETSLPAFTSANAGNHVKINGTGTGFEYGPVDLSSRVAVTAVGAANGVAPLDSDGRLPYENLPSLLSTDTYYSLVASPGNATFTIKRIFKQVIRIEALSLQTASGTCSLQLAVNGVGIGSTYTVSSTPNEFVLGSPIEVDSTANAESIDFIITAGASPTDLEVTMAISVLAE
jgi:hypothetical protein